jgi:hypothetical protein
MIKKHCKGSLWYINKLNINNMKKIFTILSCTLLLVFFLQSCQIEKRHYTSGYNIQWYSNKNKNIVSTKNKQQENKMIADNIKPDEQNIEKQNVSKTNDSPEIIAHNNNSNIQSSQNDVAILIASNDSKTNPLFLNNKKLISKENFFTKEQLSSYLSGQWLFNESKSIAENKNMKRYEQQGGTSQGNRFSVLWWFAYLLFFGGMIMVIAGDTSGVGIAFWVIGFILFLVWLFIPADHSEQRNQPQQRQQQEQQQTPQQYNDVIYLKDGGIIRGSIIEQVPNVSVKIKTKLGSVLDFKMSDVDKITKE